MKPTPDNPRQLTRVTVLMVDATYSSPALGPIDIFHSAGRLWNGFHGQPHAPCFEVQLASIGGRRLECIGALGIMPHVDVLDVGSTDLILVPTVNLHEQPADPRIVQWLRERHAQGSAVAGICAGVAYLAEAGLLDHRVATTHWAIAEQMRERYPLVQWHPERFVTEDGGVFCSGGVYASMDLSLFLVEKYAGREVALQCAKSLLLAMPRKNQTSYSVPLLTRPHEDGEMRDIEEYLRLNFARPITADVLAARVNMSPRSFLRRFKAATGQLPGAYLQALRIGAAKELLENGASSIQRVGMQVGYQDVAHFRQVFKRHTSLTPGEYREQFGTMHALVGDSHALP
ncbi:GlxA family transcriptional regulator [Massilia endophytica]|uniref:GlxA family transcriptional regulator n=1 Tax=Massilia endophytica TaxID=2899220 RepID=UPI001E576176|nr:helix-turn-helix domain-containing protein [Massilia endophytica]UGQ45432.1 helix-turn-helix domain-containing protein [Massilia endophytica]